MDFSIVCKGLRKEFQGDGIKTRALDEVNATFKKGEFVSIVGTSGSGKSTLLSILGTLDSPTSGSILYNNEDIKTYNKNGLADFRFNHIGFIFQQFHLLPTLTSLENVMAPLFSRNVSYNKKERAEAVLERVGLKDKMNSLPSQLSGGQQQRVAIARAIVHEPHWLLADEPTGNLDTETGDIIFSLLTELNREKGCGVIFVTHDPALAAKADRMIEMKDGKILSDKELARV
ncbi:MULTISPECIES: ABC transporter ATP-binding protein [Rossellomorea]|uniref:ABC transporter ATP-binding protein n=1 Tax=Rossellomorea marisflavi TaxID=189381 RepID=A0A161THY9_9BACI|nr:ABC transporter ATP-binding protein [Rossellomorea marisflavi]KML02969.1 ABC transporter ATP-binding protein [Rossellomorea marisflavi]KZE50750.1 ABC transporter ATP-binding protein [Rossellomorea marisflavi]MCM2605855.1 ABC transporter ATP-binding protein [Rossellomorea marisflavi]QHA35422.1 ATP-binding cassette domain-containing protein [Rossellomorea marisflavi]TYO71361.1 ABC transporter ATP-binding protein [Rossellomorea marisflavi]